MKTKQRKQSDLEAITENFQNSSAAMILSFSKLTVEKDQEFRSEIRAAGAKYGVVKNTLARLAVKGTPFEEVTEHFNGVTSVIWSNGEPVDLSKVVSKFVKAEKDVFEFKTGIVDGKVIAFSDVETIASLPSKDELIGKLLFLINAPAQRLVTALSAIPRDLAAVVKQVSERAGDAPAAEAASTEAPPKADAPAAETSEEKAPAESEAKDAGNAEADEKPGDAVEANDEAADTPPDEKIEEAVSTDNEKEPAVEEAVAEDGMSGDGSDSKGEGGGEPAGDESK